MCKAETLSSPSPPDFLPLIEDLTPPGWTTLSDVDFSFYVYRPRSSFSFFIIGSFPLYDSTAKESVPLQEAFVALANLFVSHRAKLGGRSVGIGSLE